jgi:hypothetical protein
MRTNPQKSFLSMLTSRPFIKYTFVSIQLIVLLEELYKESREGAPDGPVRKSSAATDECASLRGEYENFLIPQTPSDIISMYPLTTQQGVSGGDENASQHYVPAAQLSSPS